MTIQEMHTAFRTLGQQMGMQTIRSVLGESIDVYLNQAITETVRNVVLVNATTQFNDRVAIQDNSISPVNSIRTLVRKGSNTIPTMGSDKDYYSILLLTADVMYYTSFGIKYENQNKRIGARFIEGDKVDDTRSDYCNRDTWDYPIVSLSMDSASREIIELYIGDTTKKPKTLEVSYIKTPNVVKRSTDSSANVHCDLPVGIHRNIVEIAVNKFFSSIGSTTKPVSR